MSVTDTTVVRLDGARADRSRTPALLVEVPHGADTQAHYDALAARIVSSVPARLERFFHVNTDVGAWALGLRVAQRFVEAHPDASVLAIRCGIPRTFVDTNRVLDGVPSGGLTPGVPPYITDPADHALLRELHGAYTAVVDRAYAEVCGAGGLALIPHTYAPRTVPISAITASIVEDLARVYEPDVLGTAPLRPEVDLITRTPAGDDLSPPGLAEALIARLGALGHHAQVGVSYTLDPVTMGARWAVRHPGQVLCFEVRRDLVTDWEPFVEKRVRADAVDRIAGAVVDALGAR